VLNEGNIYVRQQSAVTTFLFTDIEASTRLWEQEPERMRQALACHDAITRTIIEDHRGVVVKMVGDGAQAVFDDPRDAICAAVQLQRALADPESTHGLTLRVRCGMHAGIDERRDGDFFGRSVNRAARIAAAAHGGQILVSEAVAALVAGCMPAAITLRDLSLVRLRDLARPERIYQVAHPELRFAFPPLRSLEATPSNLPMQVTSFIGRQGELAEVKRLMGVTRMLTLLGPGGIGKTRLSLQAAIEAIEDHSDGVWFVELAPLSDGQLLLQVVAAVLGVKGGAGQSVAEAVLKFVKDRQLLIILDNCEHLRQSCAELVARLLQVGPNLKILASSREPLRVAGETTLMVQPLSTPQTGEALTPSTLVQCEATRLFLERALAVHPALQLTQEDALAVADICDRLDGIPLAIELAAGRVRALSIPKIAERLSDRFRLLTRGEATALPRQKTLRASIDWSYELLSEQERALLRRLAVFAADWTLEAAEAVGTAGDRPKQDVLDLLTNLVEKSLVALEADGERYRLLETVREYAHERLKEAGEDDQARARHLAFYLALVERIGANLEGSRLRVRFSQLDLEWENLLAAYGSCAVIRGGVKARLRLVYAIKDWIISRGLFELGHRLLVEAITGIGAHERDLERCRALLAAAELGLLTGCYGEAKKYVEESLGIAREIEAPARVAEAFRLLGYATLAHGQWILAREHFEAALSLSRELRDKSLIASALNGLGELHRTQGELRTARPLYEQAVALDREVGDHRRLAIHLCNLASVLIGSGSEESYPAVLLEALAIAKEIGSKQVGRIVLEYSAGVGALRQRWGLAARLYGAAQIQSEKMGYRREPMDEAFLPPLIARTREALGESAFASAEIAGRALSYQEALAEVRAWLESPG
jgi:predicted ATPase/class 3 adenylate cyclase